MDAASRSDHVVLGLGVEAEQLRQALQERPSIDVAKGILMALYGYDEQGAFTALRRVSVHHGVALPDVAVALVDVCARTPTVTMRWIRSRPRSPGSTGNHLFRIFPVLKPSSGGSWSTRTPLLPTVPA